MVFVAPAHRRDGLAGRQRSRTPGVSFRGERRRKSITPTGVTQPTVFSASPVGSTTLATLMDVGKVFEKEL
jgi:hypothetical protein